MSIIFNDVELCLIFPQNHPKLFAWQPLPSQDHQVPRYHWPPGRPGSDGCKRYNYLPGLLRVLEMLSNNWQPQLARCLSPTKPRKNWLRFIDNYLPFIYLFTMTKWDPTSLGPVRPSQRAGCKASKYFHPTSCREAHHQLWQRWPWFIRISHGIHRYSMYGIFANVRRYAIHRVSGIWYVPLCASGSVCMCTCMRRKNIRIPLYLHLMSKVYEYT